MDVYNQRRQGVTQSDDALGRAGFTFNGLFAALDDFVFAQRDTRDMASHSIYFIVRIQLTDSLLIIGTTIVTTGMTIRIYSYVLLPEISYTSN